MNIGYQPTGIWHKYDFLINKHFWEKEGHEASLSIRKRNLIDLTNTLSEKKVMCWLQGKTLLGIFKDKELLEDHDDDVGIWAEDYSSLMMEVRPALERLGFLLIRDTGDIVSFVRDYRYVDICIFSELNKRQVKYGAKKFPKNFYSNFYTLDWESSKFNVPERAHELLIYMYSRPFNRLQTVSNCLLRRVKLLACFESRQEALIEFKSRLMTWLSNKAILRLVTMKLAGHFLGIKQVELSEQEFYNIFVEPSTSFNWKWRSRHLGLVTNDGESRQVGLIVNYLSSKKVYKKIEQNVVETDTSQLFREPLSLDMDFWWGGNNYFWYCVKYQFRHGVTSYLNANNYIRDHLAGPNLYTANYYQSLVEMSEAEIEEFLSNSPIEVIDNAVVSGKHRVFAMIGRLAEGKRYIPVRAIVL